jgi:hypothetical protein
MVNINATLLGCVKAHKHSEQNEGSDYQETDGKQCSSWK